MRRGSIALVGVLLAGCQAPGMRGTSFVLASLDRTTPVAISGHALPTASQGQVTIDFARALPKARRLLATVADVDHVDVRLTYGSNNPVQHVPKTAITAGQTSVVFSGVTPGAATYQIQVFDAANHLIGAMDGSVTVVAGQTVTVDAFVQLAPTDQAPAAAGGGGAGPTTGAVATTVHLVDGDVAQPLTLHATVDVGVGFRSLATDSPGTFWAATGGVPGGPAGLYHFDATGHLLGHLLSSRWQLASVAIADGGEIVAADEGADPTRGFFRFAPDGTPRTSPTAAYMLGGEDHELALATDGVIYANSGLPTDNLTHGLMRIAADDTVTNPNVPTGRLAGDHGGGMYSLGGGYPGQPVQLTKLDETGHVAWQIGEDGVLRSPVALTVAVDDDVWLVNGARNPATGSYDLVHLSPNGDMKGLIGLPRGLGAPEPITTFDTGNDYYVGTDNAVPTNAYVLWANSRHLVKVKDSGMMLTYYIPDDIWISHVSMDGRGHLVVLSMTDTKVRIYDLP